MSSDYIEIQIAGVPKKGEANSELLSYLQSVLKVKRNEISLSRGSTSRNKTVNVASEKLTADDLMVLLREEMES